MHHRQLRVIWVFDIGFAYVSMAQLFRFLYSLHRISAISLVSQMDNIANRNAIVSNEKLMAISSNVWEKSVSFYQWTDLIKRAEAHAHTM